ncbi:CpXC domain-containing protein [uncultured Anaerococcus sp.]|uniref:CpXC domain-containing protein n=1 Tax=uncultured Anaerococcus sp. TaxID=293428 RepID=UPI00288BD0E8|nr:CpXC domain-containing protein [uncultured Anaerococcus sp.]
MEKREKVFKIACPKCGHKFEESLPTAIFALGADREEIIAGNFANLTCPECGNKFVLNYRFAYTDEANLFMLVNDPAFVDRKARLAFSTGLGLIGAARKDELIKRTLRITYDYQALREKIAIFESGLDDKVVELMKYFLINSEDFSYDPCQIKDFIFTKDKEFHLKTVLSVGLKLEFSDILYDTIVNNYGDLIKKDMNYLIDRNWAKNFLKAE